MHPMTHPLKYATVTRWLLLTPFIAAIFAFTHSSAAQPFTPESDDSVVEILPAAVIELAADIRELE